MARYKASAYLKGDSDASSVILKTRLRYPLSASFQGDPDAASKLNYGQTVQAVGKLQGDSDAASVLSTLRRAILNRRPKIVLSVWTNDGEKPLNSATLRRGDLHHIQATVVGQKLSHFVLSSFVLKGSLNESNADAIVWKSNQPSHGGIERISTSNTIDQFGRAQQQIYQITIDPRDTASLTSRRVLQYEFQLDDTLGEIVSVAGSLTIIPDVFTYP